MITVRPTVWFEREQREWVTVPAGTPVQRVLEAELESHTLERGESEALLQCAARMRQSGHQRVVFGLLDGTVRCFDGVADVAI